MLRRSLLERQDQKEEGRVSRVSKDQKTVSSGGQNTVNKMSKLKGKKCFKTPCSHYYHKQCLLQWMEQKMECPSCRKQLPPV